MPPHRGRDSDHRSFLVQLLSRAGHIVPDGQCPDRGARPHGDLLGDRGSALAQAISQATHISAIDLGGLSVGKSYPARKG